MNKQALKKMSWSRVKLRPLPRRFHHLTGIELPPVDDTWLIESATSEALPISLNATGHGTVLPFDHIHHFMSGIGNEPGCLILHAQISISGDRLWVEPTARPGQAEETAVSSIRGWSRINDRWFVEQQAVQRFRP